VNVDISTNDKDMCLIDSATTHIILKSNTFFSCLVMREVNVSTISDTKNIIERLRKSYCTPTKRYKIAY